MTRSRLVLRILVITTLVLFGVFALAQTAGQPTGTSLPSVNIGLKGLNGKDDVNSSLKILALLTVLSIAPAILILTTAFTRIVIVLSLTRTALGTNSIPPNQVIIGLSLFLTFYVMGPTYEKINKDAIVPYTYEQIQTTAIKPMMAGKINSDQAMDAAQKPLRQFMLKNTYSKDLKLFLDVRKEKTTPDKVSLTALIPAFIISELKTAFVVGFYIFIPFVIIDLVVASILMSLGMMMMPPSIVSLPAKLLVFILADGWSLLVTTILSGYK
jgi:flagellar biosynthetic protein FliP